MMASRDPNLRASGGCCIGEQALLSRALDPVHRGASAPQARRVQRQRLACSRGRARAPAASHGCVPPPHAGRAGSECPAADAAAHSAMFRRRASLLWSTRRAAESRESARPASTAQQDAGWRAGLSHALPHPPNQSFVGRLTDQFRSVTYFTSYTGKYHCSMRIVPVYIFSVLHKIVCF